MNKVSGSKCVVNGETHYQRNRDKYITDVRENKRKKQEFIRKQKDKPCMDCGGSFPVVCMDFDHRDPSQKLVTVANAVQKGWGYDRIQVEIDKCDVVCANCHRIRTWL